MTTTEHAHIDNGHRACDCGAKLYPNYRFEPGKQTPIRDGDKWVAVVMDRKAAICTDCGEPSDICGC